jgi:hypothetical protein
MVTRMKYLIGSLSLLIPLLLPATASAGDSTWLLCKGIGEHGAKDVTKTHIVASLHEHRGTGGRDLSVTLIYGVHLNRGDILGKSLGKDADVIGKSAPLKLTSVASKGKVVFNGTGELAKDMKTFTLKGSLDGTYAQDPKPTMEPFAAKLACEVLDDLAIK